MAKTTSLAVVMDPIAKIKFAKDSTLAMLLAAAARGWQLTYFEQSDLFLRDGVALGRGRVSPFVLELLVRLEPPLRAHELEPAREAHPPASSKSGSRAIPWRMSTILLVGVDLMFRSKLEGLLDGYRLVTSDSADPPDLVICDISRVDAEDVADAWPETPILGFTNHTDTHGLQRAHAAGFDQVIVKSALAERVPEIVAELTAPSV